MSQVQAAQPSSDESCCLLRAHVNKTYQPQAEDILSDEHLLDLFRIVKQVLRKKRDPENLAKLFFCVSYALGEQVKFYKPLHGSRVIFEDRRLGANAVRLPSTGNCCGSGSSSSNNGSAFDPSHKWPDTASLSSTSSSISPASPLTRRSFMNSSSAIASDSQDQQLLQQQQTAMATTTTTTTITSHEKDDDTSTDTYTVRPYTNFRLLYPIQSNNHDRNNKYSLHLASGGSSSSSSSNIGPLDIAPLPEQLHRHGEYVMEPKQRGFYYQDGRISREPVLLQRYAEHGVLTQASLMRKRKRPLAEQASDIMTAPPATNKKPKIPHRHGEFDERRDDIISRLRSITMTDLEQKADRLPTDYSLAIETVPAPTSVPDTLTAEEAGNLLAPSLRILRDHSNMKPHLDNGMNQNGIYYNTDYFRLYLAFEQFQKAFQLLFPSRVVKLAEWTSDGYVDAGNGPSSSSADRDRDRDRNSNMKAYRSWIEPILAGTHWAAFRRNIVVGERMMQLCKVIGQGVLLMTKELSGSKLHLTFTNNEWEEFITGLCSGRWDQTIRWDHHHPSRIHIPTKSVLVAELRTKLMTRFWFYQDGLIVPGEERRRMLASEATTS